MQQIIDYVTVMFSHLPNTQDVQKAKEQILDSMLLKFEEYQKQGLKEAEAIGRVIGEFGTIHEITEALALDPNQVYIDYEEVSEMINFLPKFSFAIAFGIFAVFTGVALGFLYRELIILTTSIGLIIGISLFISFGIKMAQYKDVFDIQRTLSPADKPNIYNLRKIITPRFVSGLIIGSALILITIPLHWYLKDESYIFTLSTIAFALGLCFIVIVSIPFGIYTTLLDKNKAQPYQKSFSSVFAPLAIFAYLLIGFLTNQWHPWWIIIPAAGVISGFMDS